MYIGTRDYSERNNNNEIKGAGIHVKMNSVENVQRTETRIIRFKINKIIIERTHLTLKKKEQKKTEPEALESNTYSSSYNNRNDICLALFGSGTCYSLAL